MGLSSAAEAQQIELIGAEGVQGAQAWEARLDCKPKRLAQDMALTERILAAGLLELLFSLARLALQNRPNASDGPKLEPSIRANRDYWIDSGLGPGYSPL
jgi:hypothetical protein